MKTKTKQCENQCPKCGSEDIEWSNMEYAGPSQSAVCNTCECSFVEHYEYTETTWQGEDDENNDTI